MSQERQTRNSESVTYVYLNSRLVPAAAAYVPVFDRAFAYGDALFETLKVTRGQPVLFDDHYQRLWQGMESAGFTTALDATGLRNQAISLSEANRVREGRLRILVSRGTPAAPAGIDPGTGLNPTLLLTSEGFAGHPEQIYRQGVSCLSVPVNRGRYAHLKSAGLMASVLARMEARSAGAYEAIYTSGHGNLLEGSISNLFFHDGTNLLTAPDTEPVLAGVTRQKVLDIADETGMAVKFQAPRLEDLEPSATAAFLTGSVLGICPVREIDGVALKLDTDLASGLSARLAELELVSIDS